MYFCLVDSQRHATLEACKLAEIDSKLINEPDAAVLAYFDSVWSKMPINTQKDVLVYDLGGGTFDAAVVTISKISNSSSSSSSSTTYIETQAMVGDNCLGGLDIDERILEAVKYQIRTLPTMLRFRTLLNEDPLFISRLREICKQHKESIINNTNTGPFEMSMDATNNLIVKIPKRILEIACGKHDSINKTTFVC